jgi:hypothetical protein
VKPEPLERRLFVVSGRLFAEYLIKRRVEDERRTEVLYKRDRGIENIETRPATHADKVRLHKYTNEEKSLPHHPLSRMRDLLRSLAFAIYSQDDRCPLGFNRKEWMENLSRAKNNVQKRKAALNNLGDIVTAIIPRRRQNNWRKLLCRTCHTPLLTGYILDGQKITRGKEFCCDRCRMVKYRRGKKQNAREVFT